MKTWKPQWEVVLNKPFWSEGGYFQRYKPEFRIAIFNQCLLCVVAVLTLSAKIVRCAGGVAGGGVDVWFGAAVEIQRLGPVHDAVAAISTGVICALIQGDKAALNYAAALAEDAPLSDFRRHSPPPRRPRARPTTSRSPRRARAANRRSDRSAEKSRPGKPRSASSCRTASATRPSPSFSLPSRGDLRRDRGRRRARSRGSSRRVLALAPGDRTAAERASSAGTATRASGRGSPRSMRCCCEARRRRPMRSACCSRSKPTRPRREPKTAS